eukprot:7217426-Lingulodinium_polyedra.AAC.1
MPRLRLLPISGGIFSGPFANDMPGITIVALTIAFSLLSEAQKQKILSSKVELCIFSGQLVGAYREAAQFHAGVLREERAASASAGGPEPSPARS